MSNLTKLLIPTLVLVGIYLAFIFQPSDDIGSFDKVRASGEINQSINVKVATSRGFERDRSGRITGFYVRDKEGSEARVNLKKAAPNEIINATVVELFGHMHSDLFVAADVTVIK
jgi:hypothetical protein